MLLAFAQRSKYKVLAWTANIYVWIFRGTPMIVQIMIAFAMTHFVAPTFQLGILTVDLTRLIPGIIVISMNSGAYVSETVRAGINAVPKDSWKQLIRLVLDQSRRCVTLSCRRLSRIFFQPWEMNL